MLEILGRELTAGTIEAADATSVGNHRAQRTIRERMESETTLFAVGMLMLLLAWGRKRWLAVPARPDEEQVWRLPGHD
jgi:hypothetical protein